MQSVEGGPYLPLSQLPRADLQYLASGQPIAIVQTDGDTDIDKDVARRYAAKLLAERGA